MSSNPSKANRSPSNPQLAKKTPSSPTLVRKAPSNPQLAKKAPSNPNVKSDTKNTTPNIRTAVFPPSPSESNNFGQVIPTCSDDEWLAAAPAAPASALNLVEKKKDRVNVFATPSAQANSKQARLAKNQSSASLLGTMVANIVEQLLDHKDGTEIELTVKLGGHLHTLIKKGQGANPMSAEETKSPI